MSSIVYRPWLRLTKEELFSAGVSGLIHAAQRYPGEGISFSKYATKRVKGAMFDEARKIVRVRRRTGERIVRFVSEESAMNEPSTDASPRLSSEIADALSAVHALPERERAAIVHHYIEGKTLKETGVELGCSEAMACILVQRAMGAMRRKLAA